MLLLMLLPGACILAARRGNRSHRFTISSGKDAVQGGKSAAPDTQLHTSVLHCVPLWVLQVKFHGINEQYLHVRVFKRVRGVERGEGEEGRVMMRQQRFLLIGDRKGENRAYRQSVACETSFIIDSPYVQMQLCV